MKRNIATKSWPQMSSAELAQQTREFDDPAFCPPTLPESAGLAKRHRKALAALRSKSRSSHPRPAAQVRITLERDLLDRADELAGERGMNRSQIIAEGLELLLYKR